MPDSGPDSRRLSFWSFRPALLIPMVLAFLVGLLWFLRHWRPVVLVKWGEVSPVIIQVSFMVILSRLKELFVQRISDQARPCNRVMTDPPRAITSAELGDAVGDWSDCKGAQTGLRLQRP